MDRMLYVAMSGAKQILQAQAANAHNLANVATTGFRADLHAFTATPVRGPGFASRINALAADAGSDLSAGAVQATGRELDVAVKGSGYLAVQASDGSEAYTRAGDLRVGPGGILATGAGHPVLGDGGPVALPPYAQVHIGGDGTVSIVPLGEGATTLAALDRIRLVDPPAETLVKGRDGLLRRRDGEPAAPQANVQLASGALEASNVNAVREMVAMIELSRQWEMNVKIISAAEDNAAAASRLMQLG